MVRIDFENGFVLVQIITIIISIVIVTVLPFTLLYKKLSQKHSMNYFHYWMATSCVFFNNLKSLI